MPLSWTENRHRAAALDRGNVDSRRVFVAVFERIADQILKHLLQVRLAYVYFGQRLISHRGIAFPDRFRQVGERVLQTRR